MLEITIQSFNGIGDLLFVTPTLRQIKKFYPDCRITVNTNYPELLENNPYIDFVGRERKGIVLAYPDPIHGKEPTCHHIISDWKIVCNAYDLMTNEPELKPEIYLKFDNEREDVGVQVIHKGQWHWKKVWPYFNQLATYYKPIPRASSVVQLAKEIAGYKMVVCGEGGIAQIAKAVGTPAVVIYGGWSSPEWNGYSDQMNVCNKVDCSYCYNSYPCRREYKCLNQITLAHIRNLISEAA